MGLFQHCVTPICLFLCHHFHKMQYLEISFHNLIQTFSQSLSSIGYNHFKCKIFLYNFSPPYASHPHISKILTFTWNIWCCIQERALNSFSKIVTELIYQHSLETIFYQLIQVLITYTNIKHTRKHVVCILSTSFLFNLLNPLYLMPHLATFNVALYSQVLYNLPFNLSRKLYSQKR